MTREDAIKELQSYAEHSWGDLNDVFEMAISALRQQEHFRDVTKKVETVTKVNDLYDEDGGDIPLNVKTMTLDDAIAHLDDTLSDTGRKWSCKSCRMEHVQLRAWLAELRDIKQERNAPLTLDELRKMDGEPVWVVCLKPERYYEPPIGWRIIEKSIVDTFGVWNDSSCFAERDYGKTWLAYRQKPEEGTV